MHCAFVCGPRPVAVESRWVVFPATKASARQTGKATIAAYRNAPEIEVVMAVLLFPIQTRISFNPGAELGETV
jgi:hypothetical protein